MRRPLVAAVLASVALHLAILLGPGYRALMEPDEAESRLEARLVMPVPAVKTAPLPPEPPPVAAPAVQQAGTASPPPAPGSSDAERAPAVGEKTQAGPAEAGDRQATRKEEGTVAESPVPTLPVSEMLSAATHGSISFRVMLGRQGLVVGRMVHSWRREGGHYVLESVTETTGLAAFFRHVRLVQQSSGAMTASGLVPDEFRVTQDEGGGDVSRYGSRFDWQALRVLLEKEGERRELPLDAGAQDILSFIYQLALHPPVSRSVLRISTGKAYNRYELDYRGDERLPSPVGEVMARHYATVGPADEASTEIWLAPDLGFLPVKVRFIDRKGTVMDALIQGVDFSSLERHESVPGYGSH